jgi:protein-disulfide isomerase
MPDLQLVIMETPVLSKESTFTAKAALALKALKGVDAYREFSDAMMSVQGKASAATTIRTLVELGHDPEKITAAVSEGIGADDLEKAKRLAAALGATGTPYFVGPGGIIRGAVPAELLQQITVKTKSMAEDTDSN